MQLSVSTSSADPSLSASPLLGGDLACAATPLEGATLFSALFPGLASTATPATSTPALATTAETVPAWIGSTQPPTATPGTRLPMAERPLADAESVADGELVVSSTETPSAQPATTPRSTGTRSDTRPAVRTARRDEDAPARPAAQLPAELVPLLIPVAPAPAPLVSVLDETASTPQSEQDTDLSATGKLATASAAATTVATAYPGVTAAPITSRQSSDAPVSSAQVSRRAPVASRGAEAFAAAAETAFSGESDDTSTAASSEATPAMASTATNSFAPSELASRQFTLGARSPATSGESLRVPLEARAYSFSTPRSFPMTPVTAESATVALPTVPAPSVPTLPTSGGLQAAAEQSPAFASELLSQSLDESATPVEPAPGARVDKGSSPREAKIAASVRYFAGEKNGGHLAADKTFLNASIERVAKTDEAVGTGVAKSDAVMPATLFHNAAAPVVPQHDAVQSVAVVSSERASDLATTSVLAHEGADTAHRAVEAVLIAVDRFSAGERQSVNLDFNVGGTDLKVRVELRDDQVHASFHTDSPELRSALAHEWQAAQTADTTERSLRSVTPTFTGNNSSSDSSGFGSFAGGDGSSRQRDTGSRASGESFAAVAARGTRSASRSTESVPVAAARPATSGAHRLHAHA